jgi:hypothetical protein
MIISIIINLRPNRHQRNPLQLVSINLKIKKLHGRKEVECCCTKLKKWFSEKNSSVTNKEYGKKELFNAYISVYAL